MDLTKEECEKAHHDIKMANKYPASKYNDSRLIDFCLDTFQQLIEEHFELVDLLKKHYLENLTIKELDIWFDRSLWHVNKVNELSNKLVELSRVAKSKDEYITELRNYITQIEREFKDNPQLKFEELKPNMWVWDNKTKSYIFIFKPLNFKPIKGLRYAHQIINHSADGYYMDFEENCFFRYEVKDEH